MKPFVLNINDKFINSYIYRLACRYTYIIKAHLINVILIPKSKVLLLKIWTLQASVAVSLT